jgi:transcriptional regulator
VYVPPSFRVDDDATLHAFIRRHTFATLVSTDDDGAPFATHLPLSLSDDGRLLFGHIARANPQRRHFDRPVLATFHGPHAYVSPTLYEAEVAVPTWNYAAVHVSGRACITDDASGVRALLDRLVQEQETAGWALPPAGQVETYDNMLGAIVAFEISIDRVEGTFKLNQNRSIEDRRRVAVSLADSPHEAARQTGEMMLAGLDS